MGEDLTLFPAEFNGSLRIEARPERLTSEAGAVITREVIERLKITPWLVERIADSRDPALITHPMSELVNTSLLMLAQGWRDQDDADALRDDAVMRLAVSSRRGISPLMMRPREEGRPLHRNPEVPDGLASQPTLSRLVRTLSSESNRPVLREALLEVAARRIKASRDGHRMRYTTVDIDSLPIEVHGHQPGSEYNGHYHTRIYHPLVASLGETGDLLDVRLRKGAAHTAEGALDFILPLLDRVEQKLCQVATARIDAGFPEEKLLGALEKRGTPYLARVRNNKVLDRMAEPLLRRPPGRPPTEPRTWFHEMSYRAESWSRERRVVLVVLERADELFLHHFWIITNWTVEQMNGEALLEHYRERGSAENHMGELMDVFDPALSSSPRTKSTYRGHRIEDAAPPCDSFAHNETILLLNALAYNIAHVARVLIETGTGEGWSLRRLQERVLRVAARVLIHGRRAILVIGQASASLWRTLWSKLGRFRLAEA
ncbi:MAG: IS1380 family transposase [Burkholderiales bacterium]